MKNLKRFLFSITLTFILIFNTSLISLAESATVSITIPSFPITINGQRILNDQLEYPFILYNNITYFPMTYDFTQGLGLSLTFSLSKGLSISQNKSNPTELSVKYLVFNENQGKLSALKPTYPIYVNQKAINNTNEIYPVLNYKNITYFPLTWRFAVTEFNWNYVFDSKMGLNISSILPNEPIAAIQNTTKTSKKQTDTLDFTKAIPASYSTYDLMPLANRSLFVRDQGNSSTCWAFASNSLFEISLAHQQNLYFDFSEDHLIFGAPIPSDYDSGGNIEIASTYYTNWTGPVLESEDVFGDNMTSVEATPKYSVTDYIELSNDLKAIKYAIYQYGAVQSSISYEEKSTDLNEENFSFYNNNPDSKATHDVVIVGWDDDYDKANFNHKPLKNGAFLVQNSWGNDWGKDGLFHVSYEDSQIFKKGTAFTAFEPITPTKHLYNYNPTGITHYEGYNEVHSITGLNVFDSQNTKDEYITSIGFYTSSSDISYQIGFVNSDMPSDHFPKLEWVEKGKIAYPGYHTVILEKPIALKQNSKFSISVTFESENTEFLLPIEAPYPRIEYQITGSPGQSYKSPNPSIYEFIDLTDERPNGNIGIKVITDIIK